MSWIKPRRTRHGLMIDEVQPVEDPDVPYAEIDDLPPSVRMHLPVHAQEIYRAAFNNAWTQYAARGQLQRERIAHRVAWAAVKHKYEKVGDAWLSRD
ncbi:MULTISPECIES: ChaB family protein [unclassified Bradyrhizobium]|uniref:ChaB family protein n=1 Tax=unclassified Bradyrhizobium TaxID=2631580 RepID=UPI0028EB055E|nr:MULTISPECIES: ChaB family protein [unclassified Bradyrhizobium]